MNAHLLTLWTASCVTLKHYPISYSDAGVREKVSTDSLDGTSSLSDTGAHLWAKDSASYRL